MELIKAGISYIVFWFGLIIVMSIFETTKKSIRYASPSLKANEAKLMAIQLFLCGSVASLLLFR